MKALRFAALMLFVAACNKMSGGSGSTGNLATAEDSVSYIIGFQFGSSLKQQGAPLRSAAIAKGVEDAASAGKSRLTPEQSQAVMMSFQQKMMAEQQRVGDSVNSLSEKFLTENAKKPGVKTTPSGLQYKVVREGRGGHPKATSTVTVHYKGTLLNGTAFDSSYGGPPVTFPLNRVIPGWTEGVQLMTPGSKYEFWVPGKIGYGPEGRAPAIGPNALLYFEIELVSFK
jgi:FKBP-type peptidyl-prolyl cis-trans isomerase FkpA